MLFLIMMIIKVVGILIFIAIGNVLIKGLFALSGLLFKIGEVSFDAASAKDDVIHLHSYPMTPIGGKEVTRGFQRNLGGAFFEDAGGVDLEYRGVGAGDVRREESMLGKTVSKRAAGKHGGSR